MEIITRLSKSTRFIFLVILTVIIICFYVYGQTTANQEDWISSPQMLDFIKWAYGTYAASEIGAKMANK